MNKKNTRKGFTIVELVIVIAVIAILATVLVPTFGGIVEKANASKNLQAARNELTEYMIDNAASGNDDLIIKVANDVYYVVKSGELQQTSYKTYALALAAFADYEVTENQTEVTYTASTTTEAATAVTAIKWTVKA